jgi:hypothetical protein
VIRIEYMEQDTAETDAEDVTIDAETVEALERDERRFLEDLESGNLQRVRQEGQLRDALNFARAELDEASMNLAYASFRSEYGIDTDDVAECEEVVDESFTNIKNAESKLLEAKEAIRGGEWHE